MVVADLKLNGQAEAFMKSHDGKDLVFQRCDVTKRADLERLVEIAEEKWGEVPDVYMASAGVFEPVSIDVLCLLHFLPPPLPKKKKRKLIDSSLSKSTSNFWTDTETDSYTTLAVNVTAPLKLTRIALRAFLRSNKRGVVLLVASIAGYAGTYAVPLYTASKHAVVGFAKSMRKADAEEGVKVVALCPGVVRTPLWTPGASGASEASVTSSEGGKNGGQTNLLKDFAYPASTILEPAVVAQAAVRLAEDGAYGGGTVLECTTAGLRVIPEWGIQPPPQMEGNTGAPREVVPPEKVEVKEYLARERRRRSSKL